MIILYYEIMYHSGPNILCSFQKGTYCYNLGRKLENWSESTLKRSYKYNGHKSMCQYKRLYCILLPYCHTDAHLILQDKNHNMPFNRDFNYELKWALKWT